MLKLTDEKLMQASSTQLWCVDGNGIFLLYLGSQFLQQYEDIGTDAGPEVENQLQLLQTQFRSINRDVPVHNLDLCDLMSALYGKDWEDTVDLDSYGEVDRLNILLEAFGKALFYAWEAGRFPQLSLFGEDSEPDSLEKEYDYNPLDDSHLEHPDNDLGYGERPYQSPENQ